MTITTDRLNKIEREARAHIERCSAAANRMMDPHGKRTVHIGIVPELCRNIIALCEEVRALRAGKRGGR